MKTAKITWRFAADHEPIERESTVANNCPPGHLVELIAQGDVDERGYASEFLMDGLHLVEVISPPNLAGMYELHSDPHTGFCGYAGASTSRRHQRQQDPTHESSKRPTIGTTTVVTRDQQSQ
jgi:hypothetical protein